MGKIFDSVKKVGKKIGKSKLAGIFAATALSGMSGVAILGGAIAIPLIAGVSGYYVLHIQEKLAEEEDPDLSKVKPIELECLCQCKGIASGGSTGDVGSTGNGYGSSFTFEATRDDSDYVNQIFFYNKSVADEITIPMWVLYGVPSIETGGSNYGLTAVNWYNSTKTFTGIDSSCTSSFYERNRDGSGAAGWFQVEGVSVADESGWVMKDVDRYQNFVEQCGLDTGKYPGLQPILSAENKLGFTNWYQDCTYYPGAVLNFALELKHTYDITDTWDLLMNSDWYKSLSADDQTLVHWYCAMCYWNNGEYCNSYYNQTCIDYLEALFYVLHNRYDEFIAQKFHSYSNSGNNGPTEAVDSVQWVLANQNVLTSDEVNAINAEINKNGGGTYTRVLPRRFFCYGTNALYNAFSDNSPHSVPSNLRKHGINITGGWTPFSVNNNLSTGGSGTGSSGSYSGTGRVAASGKFTLVGDSRAVGVGQYGKSASSAGRSLESGEYGVFVNEVEDGNWVIAEGSMGVGWLDSQDNSPDSGKGHEWITKYHSNDRTLILWMGTNSTYDPVKLGQRYAAYMNSAPYTYKVVIACAYVDESKSRVKNSNVDLINQTIKDNLNSGILWVDFPNDRWQPTDPEGLHYSPTVYHEMYDWVKNTVIPDLMSKYNTNVTTPGGHQMERASIDDPTEVYAASQNSDLLDNWNTLTDESSNNLTSKDADEIFDRTMHPEKYEDDNDVFSDVLENLESVKGSTGNIGGTNNSSSKLGKMITDSSRNPDGLPLYDGFTLSGEKYDYFDVNYSQFWDGTVATTDYLYGLGDYTNKDAKNVQTVEMRTKIPYLSNPDSSTFGVSPYVERLDKCTLVDGRIALAVPPNMIVDPTSADGQYNIARIADPKNYKPLTNDPPGITGLKGWTADTAKGKYLDIVLDDGTVLAAIIGDAKNMHLGTYSGYSGIYFDDTGSIGYCQSKFSLTSSGGKGNLTSKCMFEISGYNCSNANDANNYLRDGVFSGRKVVGVRSYNIQHKKENGWTTYFTGGGTDTAFGTSGGSLSGHASMSGSGGGTVIGGNSEAGWDPTGMCICKEGCPNCKCHTGGATGGLVGGSARFTETPGYIQGPLCDLDGKNLTPQDFNNMLQALPKQDAFNTLVPTFGTGDVGDIDTQDKWRDIFNDTKGTIRYTQGGTALWHSLKLVWNANRDGSFVGSATYSGSCGYHTLSIIASTMLHKYITPTEIVARSLLNLQLVPGSTGTPSIFASPTGGICAMAFEGAHTAMDTFRYNGQAIFVDETSDVLDKAKVDATLDAGGMISYCVHGTNKGNSRSKNTWTKNGHFIAIRERVDNSDGTQSYLTVDSSNGKGASGDPNIPRTWDLLAAEAASGAQVNYITPGPAYNDYIAATTINPGSTGGITDTEGNNPYVDKTQPDGEIRINQSDPWYKYLWREGDVVADMWGWKYSTTAANKKNKTVFLDPGHLVEGAAHIKFVQSKENVLPLPDTSEAWGTGAKLGKGTDTRLLNNEPKFALEVSQIAKGLLLAEGYDVIVSRIDDDRPITNGGSGLLASQTSDILIAIHSNATGSDNESTFRNRSNTSASGLYAIYLSTSCTSTSGYDYSNIYSERGLSPSLENESKRLAELCSQEMRAATGIGAHSGGVVTDSERVFEFCRVPCTLVECGFGGSPIDGPILDNKRAEFAQGIVSAVNKYFGY